MPLAPVHKAKSPKAHVPSLPLFSDKFPVSSSSGGKSSNAAVSDSDAEPPSPYSLNLHESDYAVGPKKAMQPGQWVKVAAEGPDAGQYYLYNLQTLETKWPSPVKPGGRSVGWQLLHDAEGNAYYHNSETGDVTWDNPFEAPSASGMAPLQIPAYSPAEKTAAYRQKSPPPLQTQNLPMPAVQPQQYQPQQDQPLQQQQQQQQWEAALDPSTGAKYYYNAESGESQWGTPKKDMGKSPFRAAGDGLSPSWTQALDPSTGAKYYFNATTQESQWNTPSRTRNPNNNPLLAAPHRDSFGSPHLGSVGGTQSASLAALPPDWEMASDPETRVPYYYNLQTGESQWHVPGAVTPGRGSARWGGEGWAQGQGQELEAVPEGASVYGSYEGQEQEGAHTGGSSSGGGDAAAAGLARTSSFASIQRNISELHAQALGLHAAPNDARRPAPQTAEEVAEFLESKEDSLVRKFEKMKAVAGPLREQAFQGAVWIEWQMPGQGAVFYSRQGVPGGQWAKPQAFENADVVLAQSQGPTGGARRGKAAVSFGGEPGSDVAPAADDEGDARDASRLQGLRQRLSRSWEHGFGQGSGAEAMSMAGGGAGWSEAYGAASSSSAAAAESAIRAQQQALLGLAALRRNCPGQDDDDADDPAPDAGPPGVSGSTMLGTVKRVLAQQADNSAQRQAYSTLRSRDAAVDHDLQLKDIQVRADRAKERWREFVGPTLAHDEEQQARRGDRDAERPDGARRPLDSDDDDEEEQDGGGDSDSDAGIAVKKAPARRRRARGKGSAAVDFDALYARAIVVRQQWPWTCLVDMRSDRLFYRHEPGDYFQLEAPAEFEIEADRQDRAAREMGQEDDEDDDYDRPATKAKAKKGSRNPNRPGSSADAARPEIRPGESAHDFVARFQQELQARRDHRQAAQQTARQQQAALLDSAAREHAEADRRAEEGYARKTAGQAASSSSVVNKIRAFSEAHRLMEEGRHKRAAGQFDRRNLFARSAAEGVTPEALHRKYRQPLAASLPPPLAAHADGTRVLASSWSASPLGDDEPPLPGTASSPHTAGPKAHAREVDAAELLTRLRRMAYEPRALFVNYVEEAVSKYRKPVKDDANKGAFQEDVREATATKRALAINDLRNQERQIRALVGAVTDQLDASEHSWLEGEIGRRHLLEAAVLQRSALMFPRSPREAKAFPRLPMHASCTNAVNIPRDLAALVRSHRTTAEALGVWRLYSVLPAHEQGRTVRFYFNVKTGGVQTGEPFDVRCHRARASLTHHKWAHYDRFLPLRANFSKKGLRLLSDPEGGLLYYCPRRDKYSPSDTFDPEINFASVRAATERLAAKGRANGAKERDFFRRQQKKIEPGLMDVVPSYPHRQIPDVERDVLEFPEPNVWAGLLRLVPPTHAPAKKKAPTAAPPSAGADTPTKQQQQGQSRSRASTPTRPSSAARSRGGASAPSPGARRRPASAQARASPSPAPLPTHTHTHTQSITLSSPRPASRPHSARGSPSFSSAQPASPDAFSSTVPSALTLYGVPSASPFAASPRGAPGGASAPSPLHGVAKRFVSELGVSLGGSTVRPFSADKAALRHQQQHQQHQQHQQQQQQQQQFGDALDSDAAYDMALSFALAGGALGMGTMGGTMGGTLGGSPGGSVFGGTTASAAGRRAGKLPPLLFEADLDTGNYIEFRRLVQRLSDRPRDPVLLLELASFLHTTRLGNEALAAVQRCMEVLADWKLTHENTALCRLLVLRMTVRYTGKFERLAAIKAVARTCADSPIVVTQCAQYLQRLQFADVAESLYLAALLLDPLCNDANRSLAHLLIEKGNLAAASRYLVRVSDASALFPLVKTEQGWLQELLGADEEAVLLAYKKSLSLGLRDRSTVCTLSALGHFYHARGDHARANSFYKRALMYAPCDPQTLLLLAALANTQAGPKPKGGMAAMYSAAQVDAWMRRGLLMHPGGASRWIALLLYADSLVANQQDLAKAEEMLWRAVRLVFSREVWPTIALAHLYQYTNDGVKRARRLLLWADRRNAQLLDNLQASAPDDVEAPGTAEQRALDALYCETPVFGEGDRAALLVASAYTYLDTDEREAAVRLARKALDLAPDNTSAHRCLALALLPDRRAHKEAIEHIHESVRLAGQNPHSLRTASVVLAMEGSFAQALRLMEQAVQHGASCQLAWRALGMMTYLYNPSPRRVDLAVEYLAHAVDLSQREDFDALLLQGQLLMEAGRHKEARAAFQVAMELQPGEPLLLASLALSLAGLGFKPPAGQGLVFDYGPRLAKLSSLGSLADSENPEELFSAAATEGLDFAVKKRYQAQLAGGDQEAPSAPGPALQPPSSSSSSSSSSSAAEEGDVSPDVLYWFGMFQMNKGSHKAHVKAKALFTRAVQRADHPPHPLALYMLGWLAELKMDLATAERYYCFALQLEPMHPLAFLQLSQLAADTLQFVKGLVLGIDREEVLRKKALRQKNALRQKGVSVPVSKEGEGSSKAAEAVAARKRLLLHERVARLAALRRAQFETRVRGLHAPGKCVHVEPFWLERLLHAFTQCDDWGNLLRSSGEYKDASADGRP